MIYSEQVLLLPLNTIASEQNINYSSVRNIIKSYNSHGRTFKKQLKRSDFSQKQLDKIKKCKFNLLFITDIYLLLR